MLAAVAPLFGGGRRIRFAIALAQAVAAE